MVQPPGTWGRWSSLSQESRFQPHQALGSLRKSRSVVLGPRGRTSGQSQPHLPTPSHLVPNETGTSTWLKRGQALHPRPPCSGHDLLIWAMTMAHTSALCPPPRVHSELFLWALLSSSCTCITSVLLETRCHSSSGCPESMTINGKLPDPGQSCQAGHRELWSLGALLSASTALT